MTSAPTSLDTPLVPEEPGETDELAALLADLDNKPEAPVDAFDALLDQWDALDADSDAMTPGPRRTDDGALPDVTLVQKVPRYTQSVFDDLVESRDDADDLALSEALAMRDLFSTLRDGSRHAEAPEAFEATSEWLRTLYTDLKAQPEFEELQDACYRNSLAAWAASGALLAMSTIKQVEEPEDEEKQTEQVEQAEEPEPPEPEDSDPAEDQEVSDEDASEDGAEDEDENAPSEPPGVLDKIKNMIGNLFGGGKPDPSDPAGPDEDAVEIPAPFTGQGPNTAAAAIAGATQAAEAMLDLCDLLTVRHGYDLSPASPTELPIGEAIKIAEHLKKHPGLFAFLSRVGSLKTSLRALHRTDSLDRGILPVGVEPTRDVARALPTEIAKLASGGALATLTLAAIATDGVPGYRLRNGFPAAEGPFCLWVDQSGSMTPHQHGVQALSCAILLHAAECGRDVKMLAFSSDIQEIHLDFTTPLATLRSLERVAKCWHDGGTNFAPLFKWAEQHAGGGARPDFVLLSDGEGYIEEDTAARVLSNSSLHYFLFGTRGDPFLRERAVQVVELGRFDMNDKTLQTQLAHALDKQN